MAEQTHCASCGLALILANAPLVRVSGYLYHAICWVMREAPSARAGMMVN